MDAFSDERWDWPMKGGGGDEENSRPILRQ